MHNYHMILSQNHTAHFGFKDNANILVLGQVGTYKTRGHILPNIMEQENISMVISDTKGELKAKTEKLLRQKGYIVKSVNFDDPTSSSDCFNPLVYIRTPEDILAVSEILVSEVRGRYMADPYWDNAATSLLQAVLAYLVYECRPAERTLTNVQKLICALQIGEGRLSSTSALEVLFEDLKKKKADCFAVRQFEAFLTIKGAEKTAATIVSVLLTKFAHFLTPGIQKLTARDTLAFEELGSKKTVLFVSVSDVDRSKDKLVSVFYSLLLSRLRDLADRQRDSGLPVHVHFFLDDFSTNVVIPDFANAISSLRSREISFTLVLQSESQLQMHYGLDYRTIIANCAYYLFLGSRDLESCQEIAKRMNVPLDRVLYKPRNELVILSGFQRPIVDTIYDIRQHPHYAELDSEQEQEQLFQGLV